MKKGYKKISLLNFFSNILLKFILKFFFSGFKSNATFDLENVRILFFFFFGKIFYFCYDYWRQVISVDEEKWLS